MLNQAATKKNNKIAALKQYYNPWFVYVQLYRNHWYDWKIMDFYIAYRTHNASKTKTCPPGSKLGPHIYLGINKCTDQYCQARVESAYVGGKGRWSHLIYRNNISLSQIKRYTKVFWSSKAML